MHLVADCRGFPVYRATRVLPIVQNILYCAFRPAINICGSRVACLSHGHAVGVNISTNHLKSVTSGKLTVEATPLRIGKKIQVWQANTFDDKNNLTSNSTITLTNINKKNV